MNYSKKALILALVVTFTPEVGAMVASRLGRLPSLTKMVRQTSSQAARSFRRISQPAANGVKVRGFAPKALKVGSGLGLVTAGALCTQSKFALAEDKCCSGSEKYKDLKEIGQQYNDPEITARINELIEKAEEMKKLLLESEDNIEKDKLREEMALLTLKLVKRMAEKAEEMKKLLLESEDNIEEDIREEMALLTLKSVKRMAEEGIREEMALLTLKSVKRMVEEDENKLIQKMLERAAE